MTETVECADCGADVPKDDVRTESRTYTEELSRDVAKSLSNNPTIQPETEEVDANADVPNADYADSAGDADTVGGHRFYVQSSEPSNPDTNDIWIDTS